MKLERKMQRYNPICAAMLMVTILTTTFADAQQRTSDFVAGKPGPVWTSVTASGAASASASSVYAGARKKLPDSTESGLPDICKSQPNLPTCRKETGLPSVCLAEPKLSQCEGSAKGAKNAKP